MATSEHNRVPDILLERYLAEDLPAAERQRIESELEASDALRHRLDELRTQRDAFLEFDPPDRFAHRLATRLAVDEAEVAAAPKRRRLWTWILAPSAAAAATAAVTLMVVQTSRYEAQPSVMQESAPVGRPAADAAPTELPGSPADGGALEDREGWRREAERQPRRRAARPSATGRSATTPTKKPAGPQQFADDELNLAPVAEPAAAQPVAAPAPEMPSRTDEANVGAAGDASGAGVDASPPRKTIRTKPKAAASRGGGGSKGGKGGSKRARAVDDIFDAPSAGADSGGRVLGKSDIVNGFKKNAGNLKPCIAAAEKAGELEMGRYKLALAWEIQPDGSVRKGRMTGPKDLMGTSLPACVRKKMRSWRFPPSSQPTPVTGYPLPFAL